MDIAVVDITAAAYIAAVVDIAAVVATMAAADTAAAVDSTAMAAEDTPPVVTVATGNGGDFFESASDND